MFDGSETLRCDFEAAPVSGCLPFRYTLSPYSGTAIYCHFG